MRFGAEHEFMKTKATESLGYYLTNASIIMDTFMNDAGDKSNAQKFELAEMLEAYAHNIKIKYGDLRRQELNQ